MHTVGWVWDTQLRYEQWLTQLSQDSSEFVIFTDDPEKKFEDFKEEDFSHVDQALGIKYEKAEIREDTVLLLRYNCPQGDCDVACLGWPDLHRHVRSVHHEWMCDLCTRNKKVFTHEHELFTQQELKKHEKFGDDNPGAVDQTGFKGHPECGFCRQRFYGDDELFTHCRDKHERCHICDRRDEGRRPQYFVDYNSLEAHFRKDHFVCPDKECLEKKFVVFASEIDLKAHQIESHPNGLSKDALRDARRVDLGGFQDLRERYQPSRGRGRGGGDHNGRSDRGDRGDRGGRGRGRDPNAEPIPASSAQPMRRDELAYQRQMAITSSSSSINSRNFGGQLSAPTQETYAARGPEHAPVSMSGPARAQTSFPSLSTLRNTIDSPQPSVSPAPPQDVDLTPQEQARRARHQAVVDRASRLLRHDQPKLAEFRIKISHFKNSQTTAAEMVDFFFTLFDCPTAEVGSVVKELADIFEIASKRDDLLKAWNDWKAIHEDYPSLPGGSSAASSVAGVGGKRVLKLKTSTAQSARSKVGKAGGWGTSGNPALFPALPAGSRARGNGAAKTPWAGATPATISSQAPRPSPAPTRAGISTPPTRADAFPALPVAAKPQSSLFTPGYTGRAVLRPFVEPTTANPWTLVGAENGASGAEPSGDMFGDGQRKKGKNKKQTLMHFG